MSKPKKNKIRSGNVPEIEREVAKVNALINSAFDSDGDPIQVIDASSTWEEPTIYKPLKYSNGTLYVSYKEPYKKNRFINERVLKRDMQFDSPLKSIAKMYRKALKEKGIKFEEGGEVLETKPKRFRQARYHVLIEKEDQKPNLYWAGMDKTGISSAVKDAKEDFPNHRVFVTDVREDREIFNYEKGGSVSGTEGYEDLYGSEVVAGVNEDKRYIVKPLENYIFKTDSGKFEEYKYTGIFDRFLGYFVNMSVGAKDNKPYSNAWDVSEEIAQMMNSGKIKQYHIYTVPHVRHKFEDVITLNHLENMPLSSQLSKLTGDSWGGDNWVDEKGNPAKAYSGSKIFNAKTKRAFIIPPKLHSYVDGENLFISPTTDTIRAYPSNRMVASIDWETGELDFSKMDSGISIDRTKVKNEFLGGMIPATGSTEKIRTATTIYTQNFNEMEKEMQTGGEVDSGISRDRKFISNEDHEQRYAKETGRNAPSYRGMFKEGGEIGVGSDIEFQRSKDRKPRTGTITSELSDGAFEVISGSSQMLVRKDQIIGNANQSKLFGIFEEGGTTTMSYDIFEGYDHKNNISLYQVTGKNNEYIGEWHTSKADAEKELNDLQPTSFKEGGEIGRQIELLKKVIANDMIPEVHKSKAREKIAKLEKSKKPSPVKEESSDFAAELIKTLQSNRTKFLEKNDWGSEFYTEKIPLIKAGINKMVAAGIPKPVITDMIVGIIVKTDGEIHGSHVPRVDTFTDEYLKDVIFDELISSYNNDTFEAGFKYLDISEKSLKSLGFISLGVKQYTSTNPITKTESTRDVPTWVMDDYSAILTQTGSYFGLYVNGVKRGVTLVKAILDKATYVKDVDVYRNYLGGVGLDTSLEWLIAANEDRQKEIQADIDKGKSRAKEIEKEIEAKRKEIAKAKKDKSSKPKKDGSERFEVGTPVTFTGAMKREVSGEVVMRDGKKMVSLYKDDNYSGSSERIVEPKDWSKVKTFAEATPKKKPVKKIAKKKSSPKKIVKKKPAAKKITKKKAAPKTAAKVIKRSNKQTGSSNKEIDRQRKAMPAGKRISRTGNEYTENRANRSDKDGRTGL